MQDARVHLARDPRGLHLRARDAAFDQRARRFVRAHGSTEGNAALRVGTTLQLSGIGRRFDNSYAVVEATHRYDLISGYQTDFIAQSAYLASP